MPAERTAYLLHFHGAIPNPAHNGARHYLGSTVDLESRLNEHANGQGAKITAEFARLGIPFVLARVWDGATRTDERKLKDQKNAPRLCPVCREAT